MNKLEKAVLRRAATPAVASDAPGALTLRFGALKLLPGAIQPYLHYIEQAAAMLPGVTAASLDTASGELRIRYDAARTDGGQVRAWMNEVIDGCLDLAGSPELNQSGLKVEDVAAKVKAALGERLKRFLG